MMQCSAGEVEYVWRMITDYPAPYHPMHSGAPLSGRTAATGDKARAEPGAWHYQPMARQHRRLYLLVAALVSAGVHAAAFLFIGPTKEARPREIKYDMPTIELTMPDLKDLEEPERLPTEGDAPVDTSAYAPTLADVPQIPQPTDFVQKLDFNSLLERPDMSAAKVFAVPDNLNRGASIRQSIGTIFNIADLDRVPQPLVRPPPVFPAQYKREVMQATVRVQFIVDSNGQVLNPIVVESTHSGFNESAMNGVAKWKFRPGMKGGRRVNTRMEVPIIFTTTEE